MGSALPVVLQLDDVFLSRLAHEIARDIYPLGDVLRAHGLDEVTFQQKVINHPRFMMFYAEAHAMWNSSANAKERSALKAAVIFEEWLPEANRLLNAANEGIVGKVKLGEFIARVAGIDKEKGANVAPGDKVVVNINLSAAGGGVTTIEKEAPLTIEGTATTV